jgi:integrase
MAIGKLTKRAVDALEKGPKDQFLWDEELRGFGLKVTPAGAKVYLIQYRTGGRGSPTRRYTIGTHGSPWTAATAREEAERLLIRVRQGGNPIEERKEQEAVRRLAADSTFGGLFDTFLPHLKAKWKRSHKSAEGILRRRALPVFRSKPVGSITKGDVQGVLDSMPEEQKGARRNAYAILHFFFAWAVDDEDIPIEKSPLEKLEPPEAPDEREHTLTDFELRLAWLAAGELGYPFGPFYRLLAGTGQRREEVAAIDWRELDRTAAEWALPSTRAKNGVANAIHLTAPLVAELDVIAGGVKWPRRGLVFTTTGRTPISGYSKAKKRLDKAIRVLAVREAEADEDPASVTIEPFRGHDFRRTMATAMQRLGIRWEVIEACENRISGRSKKGSGKIYQRHDWGPEKVVAWEAWARHLLELASGLDFAAAGQILEEIAKEARRIGRHQGGNVIALAERRA